MQRSRNTTVPSFSTTEAIQPLYCPNHPTTYTKTAGWPKTHTVKERESLVETFDETALGMDAENECWHNKVITERNEGSVPATYAVYAYSHSDNDNLPCDLVTNPNPIGWWDYHFPSLGSGSFGSNGLKNIPSIVNPPASYTDPLVVQSLMAMLPQVKAGLMSINSVLELKDFSRLERLGKRAMLSSQDLYIYFKRLTKGRQVGKTLRQLTRTAADGYLTLDFAVKPLWADVWQAFLAMISFRKQANGLLKNAGKRRRKRYECLAPVGWVPSVNYTEAVSSVTYMRGGIKYYRQASFPLGDPMFRAVMEYRYDYTASQRKLMELYVAMDKFGINANPAIIWNAIPFSFIVDYFVAIGPWLDRLREGLSDPTIHIYKYVWSLKAHQFIECRAFFCPDRPEGQRSDVFMLKIFRDSYRRGVGTDAWNHCITTSGLNPKEFSYIAAMMGSRL